MTKYQAVKVRYVGLLVCLGCARLWATAWGQCQLDERRNKSLAADICTYNVDVTVGSGCDVGVTERIWTPHVVNGSLKRTLAVTSGQRVTGVVVRQKGQDMKVTNMTSGEQQLVLHIATEANAEPTQIEMFYRIVNGTTAFNPAIASERPFNNSVTWYGGPFQFTPPRRPITSPSVETNNEHGGGGDADASITLSVAKLFVNAYSEAPNTTVYINDTAATPGKLANKSSAKFTNVTDHLTLLILQGGAPQCNQLAQQPEASSSNTDTAQSRSRWWIAVVVVIIVLFLAAILVYVCIRVVRNRRRAKSPTT